MGIVNAAQLAVYEEIPEDLRERESGTHRIEYRYEPRSIRIGLVVSSGTLVAMLGVGLWELRRRHPSGSQQARQREPFLGINDRT